ncbi:quinoprotein dehydrogenase-associated SoxYZ-like carrier [Dongia deserti]|uniref:quinoprotein dehydrogenase-associated SoxYZ-like carrier n=1 Tax=Dongia deserti TaxID=2268030 RepID=UPI0013C51CF2|nr:quinoprotein dehydrogenase-associated SoxYZ-like carrier [Dongia deserti]
MRKLALSLALLGMFGTPALADEEAERQAHWAELREAVFGDRAAVAAADLIALEAPKRALDAALVPITVTTKPGSDVTGLTVVIDDNPGPVAAKVSYGPRGDASLLTLRVRVNQYTYMHAVAETSDGALHETAQFVKAAGGCSAPVGAGEAESLAQIGRMKLRLSGEVAAGQPVDAQVLIRHPNFNGMQMDQLTRLYTPMRYVQQVEITLNDERVLSMENDISLATDPAIGFRFVPRAEDLPGKLKVVVRDSDDAVFEQSFDVPASGS